jgi:hypothetical protein
MYDAFQLFGNRSTDTFKDPKIPDVANQATLDTISMLKHSHVPIDQVPDLSVKYLAKDRAHALLWSRTPKAIKLIEDIIKVGNASREL